MSSFPGLAAAFPFKELNFIFRIKWSFIKNPNNCQSSWSQICKITSQNICCSLGFLKERDNKTAQVKINSCVILAFSGKCFCDQRKLLIKSSGANIPQLLMFAALSPAVKEKLQSWMATAIKAADKSCHQVSIRNSFLLISLKYIPVSLKQSTYLPWIKIKIKSVFILKLSMWLTNL